MTPWTVVHQAPLSMGFSRQEHWSGLPFTLPGDSSQHKITLCLIFPITGIKPAPAVSPALASRFFTTSTTWEAPSWIRGALNPMDGVLRKERQIQDTQKERPHQGGDRGSIPGPLEEGVSTHSSVLAWRIPWTEEPGGLQSKGLQRVTHD